MAARKKLKPITVAVLGLGRSGWGIHIRQMRGQKEYKIVDVADPLKDRLKEAADEFGCNTYTQVKDLLKNSKAELAVVATKSSDHYGHTMAALKAGMHVVVEKPMAMKYSEAKRMVAEAKKRRRKLMIHQNQRFNNRTQMLKHYCSGKTEIGKVFSIVYQSYSFSRRNDWQCLQKYGGGTLNNKLTHIMDALLYMVGDSVASVLADMKHTTDSGNCEDNVQILMRTAKKGISINMIDSSSANIAAAPTWIIMGECGTVSGTDAEMELRYFNPRKHKKLPVLDALAANNRQYGNAEKLRWYEKTLKPAKFGIGGYYDNVWAVLRKRGKMVVDPESVVEMTRVIEECRKQNPQFKM